MGQECPKGGQERTGVPSDGARKGGDVDVIASWPRNEVEEAIERLIEQSQSAAGLGVPHAPGAVHVSAPEGLARSGPGPAGPVADAGLSQGPSCHGAAPAFGAEPIAEAEVARQHCQEETGAA